jgi:lysozyme family protein
VSDIETLLAELLRREGGFVDHPDDRGGPTNFGISSEVARAAGWAGPMQALPRDLALNIYRQRYWAGPRLDALAGIAPTVAAEVFDTGVNMGVGIAIRFLQRSLNVLNRQQRDWPDVVVDGRIGAATLAAVTALRARRGAAGERVLRRALNVLQGARYIEIAEQRPAQQAFVFGWLSERVG